MVTWKIKRRGTRKNKIKQRLPYSNTGLQRDVSLENETRRLESERNVVVKY